MKTFHIITNHCCNKFIWRGVENNSDNSNGVFVLVCRYNSRFTDNSYVSRPYIYKHCPIALVSCYLYTTAQAAGAYSWIFNGGIEHFVFITGTLSHPRLGSTLVISFLKILYLYKHGVKVHRLVSPPPSSTPLLTEL